MALHITRRRGQTIVINRNITIEVISVDRGTVRLQITAPPEVPMWRGELGDVIRAMAESRDK